MSKVSNIPSKVDLEYHLIGQEHVFCSKDLKGMIHVGDKDLHTAFEQAISALNQHVGYIYNCEVNYTSSTSRDELERMASVRTSEITCQIKVEFDEGKSNCH